MPHNVRYWAIADVRRADARKVRLWAESGRAACSVMVSHSNLVAVRQRQRGLLDGVGGRDLIIGASVFCVPFTILALLAAAFLKPVPFSRQLLLGCYVANGAPPLLITPESINIADSEHTRLTYEVGPQKDGYYVTVHPATDLKADPPGSYSFAETGGSGFYWELLSKAAMTHMRDANDFGGWINVLASDGRNVLYGRLRSPAPCHT